MLLPEEKKKLIDDFKRHETDVGSSEVQIAILSRRIKILEEHLKKHRKDFSSKRTLYILISRRMKLLKYLKRENPQRYEFVVEKLGLKGPRE